jgi:TonB-linked SusC/RagA family outer membrane protein
MQYVMECNPTSFTEVRQHEANPSARLADQPGISATTTGSASATPPIIAHPPVGSSRAITLTSLALLLFAFFWAAPVATAQYTVTGTITDAEFNDTMPGVNVLVKNTLRGVASDLDGRFSLQLEEGEHILVFSFTGYETQEITVSGPADLAILLQPSNLMMDELVVIGYGAVRKRDMTGAVSSIRSEDIGKTTSLNAEQSLQGRVSGVHITTTSGAPGAGSAVRIRGVGTFNNSSPIYVVDGVILDDISFLNPADISSMEILKDASATAIYGSRGANGVILVTTRTGSSTMDRPVVSVSMERGYQQLERTIDLLDGRQFATIANEIRSGSFNNVDAVPNIDWQDLIFNVAPMQQYQVSVAGSGDWSDYYVSLGYFQQDGIIDRSAFERITLKLNNTYRVSPVFRMGNNLTFAPYSQQVAPNVVFTAYRAQPVLPPYYDDGRFASVLNVGNPLASLANANNYNSGIRIVGNVYAEAILANAFILRSSFGTDAALNRGKSFTPAYTVFNPDGSASQQQNEFSNISKNEGLNYTWLAEQTLTWTQRFNRHSVNAVVGFTMQQTRSENMSMAGRNVMRDGRDFWYVRPSYIIDESNNINMLASVFNGVDAGQYYNMVSFLGRVVYSYRDRYLVTATLRRDGSSKFAADNRWGYFPSFALGWNMQDEAFLSGLTALNDLKVRVSWGIIGNEKISYFDRFSRVNSGLLTVFGNPDTPYTAATYGKSGNPDLKWESTTQTDIGVEFGLFDRRLTGEFDFYSRTTDDILVELATPGHLGNGQGQRVRYNAASILNRGIELSMTWTDRFGNLGYSVGMVSTTIHNEVLAIGGSSGIDSLLVGGWLPNGQSVTLTRVGQPIGAFYGYKTDGLFQNQQELNSYPRLSQAGIGDLRFVDVNGDGVLNADDRTYLGSPIPKFVYGFNIDLEYRNWDLSIGLQGQYGNKIFNGKNVVRPDPYNFEAHVWDRWTGEGTSTNEPRPSYGGYNFLPSDRFIHDGSYLRLRSLVLGYQLPGSVLRRTGMTRARIFMKGNNLLTITGYSGYTPEIGSFDVLSNGIDYGVYPIPRIVTIGINTTF